MPIDRDEFLQWMERLDKRLDAINGTVREHEVEIAIIKDRGQRDPTARWGAGISVAVLGVLEGVHQWLGSK